MMTFSINIFLISQTDSKLRQTQKAKDHKYYNYVQVNRQWTAFQRLSKRPSIKISMPHSRKIFPRPTSTILANCY